MKNSLEKADFIVDCQNTTDNLDQIALLDAACFPDRGWDITTWNGLFNHLQLRVFLSFRKNQPVGYLAISLLPPEAELLRLGVREEFRRHAIGSELVDCMMRELNEKTVSTVFLEVREDNLPARLFYQARGFVKTGERKNYYRSPVCDAFIFRCRVSDDMI